jgi:microcystin-dependent protein
MADPFVGQLALVGFNFNPGGWQIAAGQILPISQNTALFSLLGTMYGGNGTSNFQLPNLQGCVAIGFGQAPGLSLYDQGETGGVPNVTLLASQTPNHNHTCMAKSTLSDATAPVVNTFADSKSGNIYSTNAASPPLIPMSSAALPPFPGGSQPHNNMMPYLGLYWIISMQGIFPQRP